MVLVVTVSHCWWTWPHFRCHIDWNLWEFVLSATICSDLFEFGYIYQIDDVCMPMSYLCVLTVQFSETSSLCRFLLSNHHIINSTFIYMYMLGGIMPLCDFTWSIFHNTSYVIYLCETYNLYIKILIWQRHICNK